MQVKKMKRAFLTEGIFIDKDPVEGGTVASVKN